MALDVPVLLVRNQSNSTAASYTTAAINPAAGSKVLAKFTCRAADLAPMTAETLRAVGCATTWTPLQTQFFDGTAGNFGRMADVLFEGVGPFTNEAVVLDAVSGRSLDRGTWTFVQLTADGTPVVVQSAKAASASGGSATAITVTLAAFADAGNIAILFADDGTSTQDWTLDTDYVDLLGDLTAIRNSASYHVGEDTTPLVTSNGPIPYAAVGVEFGESAAGPTIDTDPVSGTACVAPAYPVTMTGAFTAGADPIQTVTWEKDGTPIADGGDYAITTNIGAGTTQLVITPSDDTDDGAEFTFVVDDEVAAPVESAAATLTVKDGPTASATIGPTDSSGEASGSVTTDFVQPDGVFLRLPYTAGGLTQVTLVKAVAP